MFPAPLHDSPSYLDASGGEESDSDIEQEYERLPRKTKQKESSRLPIKTAEGWIAQDAKEEAKNDDSDSFLESDDGLENEDHEAEESGDEVEDNGPKLSHREQVMKAKEDLARIASLINEDPEEHVGGLRALAHVAHTSNITVKQLAIATQCAVYKDIIPGYRIRPLSEDEMKEKVSKEVKRFRNYEQSIVSGYQAYVRGLGRLARVRRGNGKAWNRKLSVHGHSMCVNLTALCTAFQFQGRPFEDRSRSAWSQEYKEDKRRLRQVPPDS